MAEYKGVTKTGFEFVIDEDAIDMELLDDLADASENGAVLGRIIMRMLGKEQKKRFYDFIRNENGKVPIDKASEGLIDFFNAVKAGKNL
jgi:hypothetical protein